MNPAFSQRAGVSRPDCGDERSTDVDPDRDAVRLLLRELRGESQGARALGFSETFARAEELGYVDSDAAARVRRHADRLDRAICDERDGLFDHAGLAVLARDFLLRHPATHRLIETPQQFWMRRAVAGAESADDIVALYDRYSRFEYLPALTRQPLRGQDRLARGAVESWRTDIEAVLLALGDAAIGLHDPSEPPFASRIPDLFMQRVEADGDWSLFHPDDVPELAERSGEAFEAAYAAAEARGLATHRVRARDLFGLMMRTIARTDGIALDFCDSSACECSRTTERVVPSAAGVINLARHVGETEFDFARLEETVEIAVRQLDPHGVGPVPLAVMGLQDVFFQLKLPFDGYDARALSTAIAESICHRVGFAPSWLASDPELAVIAGCYECAEPQRSNVVRRQINRYLVADLKQAGLWSAAMRASIARADGSVQALDEIPDALRTLYRTAWELSGLALIDLAADRNAFVEQGFALNLYYSDVNVAQLSRTYLYAWRSGLKATCTVQSRSDRRRSPSRDASAAPQLHMLPDLLHVN